MGFVLVAGGCCEGAIASRLAHALIRLKTRCCLLPAVTLPTTWAASRLFDDVLIMFDYVQFDQSIMNEMILFLLMNEMIPYKAMHATFIRARALEVRFAQNVACRYLE